MESSSSLSSNSQQASEIEENDVEREELPAAKPKEWCIYFGF